MDRSTIPMEEIPVGRNELKQELNRVHLWAHIRKQVAAIVSGERKKAIERGKNANGNGG